MTEPSPTASDGIPVHLAVGDNPPIYLGGIVRPELLPVLLRTHADRLERTTTPPPAVAVDP